jgi:hypothetical protein
MKYNCYHSLSHVFVIVYFAGASLIFFMPPLPEEGALPEESAPLDNEALETVEIEMGINLKTPQRGLNPTSQFPLQVLKGEMEGRKKCQDDLQSSGTSKAMDAPYKLATSSVQKPLPTLFDLARTDSRVYTLLP